MMEAVMYGMMPNENTEKFDTRAAREQVEHGHGHAAALRELGSELVEGYAGNRHVGAEAVERKDS